MSLTVAGILQTIPTLAILALMIPTFGVGKTKQLLHYLLPITKNNTIVGVQNIDSNVKKQDVVWE